MNNLEPAGRGSAVACECASEDDDGWARVAKALPIGVYACDQDGRLTRYNREAALLWGWEPDIGADAPRYCGARRLFDPSGTPMAHRDTPLAEALRTGGPVRGRQFLVERPDGSRVAIQADAVPLFDEAGTIIGGVSSIQHSKATATTGEGHPADLRGLQGIVDATPDCITLPAHHNLSSVIFDGTGALADTPDGRESENYRAYLAAIVSSSDDAIISKTLEGRVTSWNTGASRIFGYAPEEMIGQSITRIIPHELLAEEEHILSKLRNGERIEHYDTVRLSKDGRRLDVSLTVSPVRDKSGRLIGASKVARDITDRKHSEKLQQLLVSELNHRVKNTLAAVQSIANQTVRLARSPAEFASSFGGRVQALARTHTLLTSNTWHGTDIHSLIRDQLLVEGDARIALSGPTVTLEPQVALHLALVLHELGTNALKYGALSAPTGTLVVRWAVLSNGGRNLVMEWQERGGPPVHPPTTRGFGTTLIEQSLLAHGGTAVLSYNAAGLTCELTLPLTERTESPFAPAGAKDAHGPRPTGSSDIANKRILVVEDEPLVAMDLIATLVDGGCDVVGPAATLEKALALIHTCKVDAALLDANLGGTPVDALAAALSRAAIPFAFLTGYSRDALPEPFRNAPLITKPFSKRSLFNVLGQLISPNAATAQLKPP